jgi:gentisate 1,2-dioxygenase
MRRIEALFIPYEGVRSKTMKMGEEGMTERTNVKSLEKLHQEMANVHLGPLWSSIHQLNTVEPVAKPVPYLWKQELIQHFLEQAEHMLEVGNGADRRAVFLINPGMEDLQPLGWGGATQTLYVAVQAVKPGEVASAHRHTTSALRFIMQGHGASGRVDGQKLTFEPGDYLITPGGSWHDHANEGDEVVTWMDCLDVPFTMYMNVCFTDFYPEKQQALTMPNDYGTKQYQGGMVRPIAERNQAAPSLGRYTWDLTEKSLRGMSEFDADPYDGYSVEYINPLNGKDADGRIGARMTALPKSYIGKAHRHVHSTVYHVFQGNGYSVINGTRFDWSEGDFFVVPAWTWHEHVNLSGEEEAFLFSVNDLPIMETFGFERQQVMETNDGHQDIEDVFKPVLP